MAKYDIRSLSSYPSEERTRILNKYYKVTFVRHPLERLLSAYLSKIADNADNHMNRGKKIFSRVKSEIITKTRKVTKDTNPQVTFEEFLEYVMMDNPYRFWVDIHWNLYNDACHFCDVDFDFIGSFETLEDDVSYVLRKMYSSEQDYWFPHCNPSDKKSAMEYYRSISKGLLDKLEKYYEMDFDLFGFEKGRFSNT